MDLHLSKKIVFISGSTKGIGLGIAKQFLAEGATVVFNSRDEASGAPVARAHNSPYICADMNDLSAVQGAMSKIKDLFGRLDVLICNVGSGRSVPPLQEDPAEVERMLNINFKAALLPIFSAKNMLIESKGSIACVSSICGVETIQGAPSGYSVAKAALNAYVKNTSKPLGALGVRINAVAAGNVLFPGSVWELKMREDSNAVQSMLERGVALKKLGAVEDIAAAVVFLSSANASFITGTVLVVDGGQVH